MPPFVLPRIEAELLSRPHHPPIQSNLFKVLYGGALICRSELISCPKSTSFNVLQNNNTVCNLSAPRRAMLIAIIYTLFAETANVSYLSYHLLLKNASEEHSSDARISVMHCMLITYPLRSVLCNCRSCWHRQGYSAC